MRRAHLRASARRAGLRVSHIEGVECTRRVYRRVRWFDCRRAMVQCTTCGCAWSVKLPRKGERKRWRGCPKGCNADKLAKG